MTHSCLQDIPPQNHVPSLNSTTWEWEEGGGETGTNWNPSIQPRIRSCPPPPHSMECAGQRGIYDQTIACWDRDASFSRRRASLPLRWLCPLNWTGNGQVPMDAERRRGSFLTSTNELLCARFFQGIWKLNIRVSLLRPPASPRSHRFVPYSTSQSTSLDTHQLHTYSNTAAPTTQLGSQSSVNNCHRPRAPFEPRPARDQWIQCRKDTATGRGGTQSQEGAGQEEEEHPRCWVHWGLPQ